MAASVSKNVIRILESSPKLSQTYATMKHYKKMFLTKQFLKEVLSLYFDFILNKFRYKTQMLKPWTTSCHCCSYSIYVIKVFNRFLYIMKIITLPYVVWILIIIESFGVHKQINISYASISNFTCKEKFHVQLNSELIET